MKWNITTALLRHSFEWGIGKALVVAAEPLLNISMAVDNRTQVFTQWND